MKHEVFNKELDSIKSPDISEFAIYLLNEADDYFFTMPASTTNKYHPSYALGDGGLVRHTQALVGIMNHLLALQQYQELFSDREMDLLRVAGLVHDIKKKGNKGSEYTVHEHPLCAGEYVEEKWNEFRLLNTLNIKKSEMNYIQSLCASHMGQWNTSKYSSIELPLPITDAQQLLHLCDYLASRKNLEFIFDETNLTSNGKTYSSSVSIDQYRMPFGKHKDELIRNVAYEDFGYIEWLSTIETADVTLKSHVIEILANRQAYDELNKENNK